MRKPQVRRLAITATALFAAVLLAGCGGDDHGAMDHGGDSPAVNAPSGGTPSSGATFNDTDVLFATDMIVHHRQAIDMARTAETRAKDPRIKDLASQVKAAQDPEINTMSGWLRQWGQPVPSPEPATAGMDHGGHTAGMDHGADMPGMMTQQEMHNLTTASGAAFDKLFLQMMIRHHQGAIEMASTAQQQGQDPQVKQLAKKIEDDQTGEVVQMQGLLNKLS